MKKASLAAAISLFALSVSAQTSPLWGDLKPGPYSAGVRSLLEADPSRSWEDPASIETKWLPRPIRMLLWYPIAKTQRHGKFAQYVETPRSTFPVNVAATFADLDMGREAMGKGIPGFFGGDAEAVQALLNTPVNAVANAQPAKGHFPLVVYALGQNDILQENV